jgi:hypothetical protein
MVGAVARRGARRRIARVLTPVDTRPWDRGRLIAIVAGAIVVCLLAVLGLGLAVYYTLRPDHHPAITKGRTDGAAAPSVTSAAHSTAVPGSQQYAQDVLAARPMPTVALDAAEPGPVSTRDPGTIQLPGATGAGPADVPTGFPHTPAGALAQLAAIDKTAMQSGTLSGVRAVIVDWAAPGGPNQETWSAVGAMASFLTAAGLSGGGSGQLALVVTPLMGLIKGSVGPDFVVACVDFQFDATLQTTQHVASADCQRMIWQGERWIIGPGSEPAVPPSVWADTDEAIAVGYQDLRNG